MDTIQMYDAQADTIRIEDIELFHDNNRTILRRMKRNSAADSETLYIQNQQDIDLDDDEGETGEACVDYIPESAYDMGWLGYFVGRNNHLKELYIRYFDTASIDIIESFFKGVRNNRSITRLDFCSCSMNLLDGKIFTMMSPFFENNNNLSRIIINDCDLEDDGLRLLALAIGSNKHKSLQDVSLTNCNITDEELVEIIEALSMHPNLQRFDIDGNCLRNGCMTLSTLLRCSTTQLNTLNISNNEIDDEGIDALLPALKNCSHLETLKLTRNESITTKGWKQLASILEAPNSKLISLYIQHNNVDEEALVAIADALKSNRTLQLLSLGSGTSPSTINTPIYLEGEPSQAFTKLLCDTSSVNSTFSSNHTFSMLLGLVLRDDNTNGASVNSLLDLNYRRDKKEVAMIKILHHHNDINMMPFFEWEFKVLPLIINWFERASSIPTRIDPTMPEVFEPSTIPMPEVFKPSIISIEPRKLSSIYQFIRGMPLLYVETRLRKELEDIKAAQAQLEERKRSILERLGRNA